ncbi:tail fiber assembly protein [Xenorhabdus stockiae]|uniref:tail fiber assembly protein n=1 Tax=Xenorhabdus stockiae TaxID=351614 RepID=UPI0024529019|nr:tail fiber assembly protein [Xenorhabdus stockiae]
MYAYEADGSQDESIKPHLLPISRGEAMAIVNPPPTPEQLAAEAEAQKRYLMSQAAITIAPFQDAVDLDMATKEEKAALLKWKKYRVLLNRVDCSTAPDIVWPEQPE